VEGDVVGAAVGPVVGDVVGHEDGDVDGDVVGPGVGIVVGDGVGIVVGDVVGPVVGDGVGLAVKIFSVQVTLCEYLCTNFKSKSASAIDSRTMFFIPSIPRKSSIELRSPEIFLLESSGLIPAQ